jgi:hypothetical protein
MIPDDRAPDLKSADPDPFAGRPIPPASANVEVRAREFRDRVLELVSLHDASVDRAVLRTYREFDRVHKADEKAPGFSELTIGQKIAAVVILLIILAIVMPVLGWAVGDLLIPAYEWGFQRWL